MKNNLYILLLLSFFCQTTTAQQTSRIAQSADEFGLDNPAGLSIEEMRYRGTTLGLFVRQQWWRTSAVGNPQTQTLTWLDNRSDRQHFGLAAMADKIGETRQFGFIGRYAHQVAPGLKAGVNAGFSSWQVNVNNLDRYDDDDPLAASAGDLRWRLNAGAGIFYHRMQSFKDWNWFGGLSVRRTFFVGKLTGSTEDAPVENHLLVQGGLGWSGWWAGGRLRADPRQPDAVDVYLRKFLAEYNYFIGVLATSDFAHQTAGAQMGGQWALSKADLSSRHYLSVSLGFSKPLSKYVESGNLIFDARAVWSWAHKGKGKVVGSEGF